MVGCACCCTSSIDGWTSKIVQTISRVQSFSHTCTTLCASTFGSQVESSLGRATLGLLGSDFLAGCFHGHCCHVHGMSWHGRACHSWSPAVFALCCMSSIRIGLSIDAEFYLCFSTILWYSTSATECSLCGLSYSACRCSLATTRSNAATNSSCQTADRQPQQVLHQDSGDSAHSGDSGDSGDSADSAHSGHSGDSGDSGHSAHQVFLRPEWFRALVVCSCCSVLRLPHALCRTGSSSPASSALCICRHHARCRQGV
jgi:hypothetical protein